MSWLGPASSGAHPRTKGAQCFAGGHRHRIPLTAKGLPSARARGQAIGRPFAVDGRDADQQNPHGADRRKVTFGSHGQDRPPRRAQETGRRCALGVPQGMRDTDHAIDSWHGSRGTTSVNRLCGSRHHGGCVKHRAWTHRTRPAACLYSQDSDCMTRMGHSCRYAGAWVHRIAGMPAPGEL